MHGMDLDSRQNPIVRVRIYGRASRETLCKVYLLLYMSICLHVCVGTYHVNVWFPWKPEEGLTFPETGDVCTSGLFYGCFVPNLGPLREQQVLSTTKPSL